MEAWRRRTNDVDNHGTEENRPLAREEIPRGRGPTNGDGWGFHKEEEDPPLTAGAEKPEMGASAAAAVDCGRGRRRGPFRFVPTTVAGAAAALLLRNVSNDRAVGGGRNATDRQEQVHRFILLPPPEPKENEECAPLWFWICVWLPKPLSSCFHVFGS